MDHGQVTLQTHTAQEQQTSGHAGHEDKKPRLNVRELWIISENGVQQAGDGEEDLGRGVTEGENRRNVRSTFEEEEKDDEAVQNEAQQELHD